MNVCLTFFVDTSDFRAYRFRQLSAGCDTGFRERTESGPTRPTQKSKASALLFLWLSFGKEQTPSRHHPPAIPSDMISEEMIQWMTVVSTAAITVVKPILRHSIGRAGAEGA